MRLCREVADWTEVGRIEEVSPGIPGGENGKLMNGTREAPALICGREAAIRSRRRRHDDDNHHHTTTLSALECFPLPTIGRRKTWKIFIRETNMESDSRLREQTPRQRLPVSLPFVVLDLISARTGPKTAAGGSIRKTTVARKKQIIVSSDNASWRKCSDARPAR